MRCWCKCDVFGYLIVLARCGSLCFGCGASIGLGWCWCLCYCSWFVGCFNLVKGLIAECSVSYTFRFLAVVRLVFVFGWSFSSFWWVAYAFGVLMFGV